MLFTIHACQSKYTLYVACITKLPNTQSVYKCLHASFSWYRILIGDRVMLSSLVCRDILLVDSFLSSGSMDNILFTLEKQRVAQQRQPHHLYFCLNQHGMGVPFKTLMPKKFCSECWHLPSKDIPQLLLVYCNNTSLPKMRDVL